MFLLTMISALLVVVILFVGNGVSLVPINDNYEVNLINDTEVQVEIYDNILKDKELTVNEANDNIKEQN